MSSMAHRRSFGIVNAAKSGVSPSKYVNAMGKKSKKGKHRRAPLLAWSMCAPLSSRISTHSKRSFKAAMYRGVFPPAVVYSIISTERVNDRSLPSEVLLTSAPLSRSSLTHARLPCRTAKCSAVPPSASSCIDLPLFRTYVVAKIQHTLLLVRQENRAPTDERDVHVCVFVQQHLLQPIHVGSSDCGKPRVHVHNLTTVVLRVGHGRHLRKAARLHVKVTPF